MRCDAHIFLHVFFSPKDAVRMREWHHVEYHDKRRREREGAGAGAD